MASTAWREPYEVALALRDEPGLVLLESGAGFHGHSMIAVRPAEVVNGGLAALDRLDGGCWAGWLSYDLGREIERLPRRARDDRGVPSLALARYEAWIEFDHLAREARVEGEGPLRRLLADALQADHLPRPVFEPAHEWRSSLPRPRYEQAVRDAIDLIRAGDMFQVNLSQRLTAEWDGNPIALYGRVREVAAAPYMGLVRLAGIDVVSASPELFLRRRGAEIETRPIKGTRPRGRDAATDATLAEQLRESDKDRAENVMIVDLSRNDLGRVCEYGSVEVAGLCELETHAGVHHLVSTVRGRLRLGTRPLDVVQATFPPGSVTGAPKIRASEVIEQLEPVRRGAYCGSLAWFRPNGDFDLSVAIRTLVATPGRLDLHVGGAVVADSDPHGEWRESMHKAAPLLQAAGGQVTEAG